MHTQVLRGLGIANPALLDQPYGLKLELPRKLPPLHDAPPVPLKHLTWCLRNRVRAKKYNLPKDVHIRNVNCAQYELKRTGPSEKCIQAIAYRPFDERFI